MSAASEKLMVTYRDNFTGGGSLDTRLEAFRGRKTFRVLVTGSRSWMHPDVVETALDILYAAARVRSRRMIIREGGCKKGPDTTSRNWAIAHGGLEQNRTPEMVVLDTWAADWSGGRGGGMRRNQDMVDGGADVCLAFICDGSPGASHCAERAEAAGIVTITWEDTAGKLYWPTPGWGHLVPV